MDNEGLGHLRIDGFGDFNKFEIKFNKVNIFAGKNGSGKSLVMKMAWYASYVMQSYKLLAIVAGDKADEMAKTMASELFEMTFKEPETMSLTLGISDKLKSVYDLEMKIDNGKVVEFKMDIKDVPTFGLFEISAIRYGSKDTRTIDNYATYLKIKNMLGGLDSDEKLKQMCKDFYPLYDVLMFEAVGMFIDHIEQKDVEAMTRVNTVLKLMSEKYNFKHSENATLIVKDGLPILKDGDTEKPLTSMSAGEQSLMMMMIFYMG